MKNYDLIIIGAGISGASMAQYVAKMGKKVLVLEQDSVIGGVIKNMEYNDYCVEVGAHTIYNSYTTLLKLIEVVGIEEKIVERKKQKYFFVKDGRFQKLLSQLNVFSLLYNLPTIRKIKKADYTVKEYYSKVLGRKNYSRFARHFFKAVLSQNPDDFPADKVLKIRKEKNKSYPRSITFEKGLKTIIESFLNDTNITVVTDCNIEKCEKVGEMYQIQTQQEIFSASSITFALHADKATALVADISSSLAESLEQIKYNEIASLGVVVDRETCKQPFFAGLLSQTDMFSSIVSRDVFPHEKYRGFTIHSEQEKEESVLEQLLCCELSLSAENFLSRSFQINRLPVLDLSHNEIVETIEKELQAEKGVYLVGNYFSGLSIEDCVLRAEKEALRFLNDN